MAVLAFLLAVPGLLQAQQAQESEPDLLAPGADALAEAEEDLAREGDIARERDLPQEERIGSPFQWIERSLRLGVLGGWRAGARGDLSFGPGAAEMAGARLRARVSSPLSLEVGLSSGFSDRFVIDPLASGGPRTVDTMPLRWVALDGGFQLALTGARTWHRLHPYVVLGPGLAVGVDEPANPLEIPPPAEEPENGEPDAEAGRAGSILAQENGQMDRDLSPFRYEMNAAPYFHVGLGTELLLSDRLGVSVEARNHIFRLRAPEGFFQPEVLETLEDAGLAVPQERQWTNNLHLNLSLWYYF